MRNSYSAANIAHYAKIVRDKATKRAMLSTATDIIEKTRAPDGKTSEEILNEALEEIIEIGENNGHREVKEAKNIIGQVIADIDLRSEKGGVIGLSTGFDDIDRITHGLRKGDLIVLAGRPSMGKTVLSSNIAENISVKNDGVSLIFSLEMSAEQLVERSLSSIAKIDANTLKMGVFAQAECDKLSGALPIFQKSKMFIDDRAGLTLSEMRTACRKIKKDHGLSLVVVDYITLVGGEGENEVIRIGNISRGLKIIARDLDVPIIAISQLNRGVEHRVDKRPMMSDLRSSGAIEQDADLILLLYRDEFYYPDTNNKSVAELIVAKNRNGETGMINLFFNKQFCRFDAYTGKYVKYSPSEKSGSWQESEFNY
jgi:replicative DNA helicase